MDSKQLKETEGQASPVRGRLLSPFVELKRFGFLKLFPAVIGGAGLVAGLWIRVLFFQSFPDPLPTPDTWGYLTGSFSLLETGHFDLFAQRTPVFPLMVWAVLAIFRSFAALTVVQGALTLLSALGVVHVVRAFGGPWRLPAALAFAFMALHPHVLYWEHFVLTEASFQALFTLAICAIALAVLRKTLSHAAAAGVLAAIAALVRPQGLLLTPLMLLALAWTGRSMERRKLLLMLATAGAGSLLLVGGWSLRNKVVHGFFGLSNIGPIQLFGVSARWIDLESPSLAEDKALISDSIRRYQSMPEDLVWAQYEQDGPGYLIDRKYANDPNRRDEVYNALGREAIVNHPMAFARRGIKTTYQMIFYRVPYPEGFVTIQHPVDFATNWYRWNPNWESLSDKFATDQYRAALDQARYPMKSRESTFDRYIRPILAWETIFIRGSLMLTLAALFSLPLLHGPRRLVVGLAVISVIVLILTAGFLSEAEQRYLATVHGSASLAGALALAGLIERWQAHRKI